MQNRRTFLRGSRIRRFLAIQNCLVPRSRHFDAAQKAESIALVNDILADKTPGIHFKIALFLRVIDVVSLLGTGHVFRQADEARQNRVMKFFFDSPITLLRKGFWGLNTLAKLGVYGQSSVYPELGYRLKEAPL